MDLHLARIGIALLAVCDVCVVGWLLWTWAPLSKSSISRIVVFVVIFSFAGGGCQMLQWHLHKIASGQQRMDGFVAYTIIAEMLVTAALIAYFRRRGPRQPAIR